MKITTQVIDLTAPTAIDTLTAAIKSSVGSDQKSQTRMVWLESPTNPTMKVVDIRAIATAVHGIDPSILVVVDNTFMSAYRMCASHAVVGWIGRYGLTRYWYCCLVRSSKSVIARSRYRAAFNH